MNEAKQLDNFSRYLITKSSYVYYKDKNKICPDYSKGKKYKGYRKIKLYNDNHERKIFSVHRLVWLAFCGVIPEGYEVDHIDHNRSNNHIDNLRIVPSHFNRGRFNAINK